jgi:L-lactate dehydrogenase
VTARESGHSKVAIVGAGRVGSSIAYACLIRGVARRIALFDKDEARARAEVLDLSHGRQFAPAAEVEGGGSVEACRDADVVVLTAGASQRPEQSRLDLVKTNVDLYRSLVPDLARVAPRSILLVVANPVDVLTHACREIAGLSHERVFGTGTTLDTSRFRFALAGRCDVAVSNVHAVIVGEHGDSELPLWSSATIAGSPVEDWLRSRGRPFEPGERDRIFAGVRDAAYEIIRGKGATHYAIGLATARILEAILEDEHAVLPVSAHVRGDHGLPPVTLSLPRLVGRRGAGELVPVRLSKEEGEALHHSAETIRSVAASVGLSV